MRPWILSLLLAGCASTPSHPEPATPPPPPAPRGELEHGMRNCPNALAGAATELTRTDAGVDLTITASDPAVRDRILDLARMHERMGDPDGSAMQHTGLHGGPGSLGYCPIIHAATRVTVTPLPNGATVHLSALVAADVPQLQASVAERLAQLPAH